MEKRQSVCLSDYEYKQNLIHTGRQNKIYKAVNRQNHDKNQQFFVFKAYPEDYLNDPIKEKKLNKELQILWKLHGKENILQVVSQHFRDKQVFIISEYCQNGSIADQIKKNGSFAQEKAVAYLQQIIKGYQFIYQKKIIHRNIQPGNILIAGFQLKIADFSDAIFMSQAVLTMKKQQMVGNLHYQAPQVLQTYKYSTKSDIYSIGLILYFMLKGKLPYQGNNKTQILNNMKQQKIEDKLQVNWHQKTKLFLIKSLSTENERMNINELVDFKFNFIPNFKLAKHFTFQDESYDMVMEQSMIGYNSVLNKQQNSNIRQSNNIKHSNSMKVSILDLKASQQDFSKMRYPKDREISIYIPTKLNFNNTNDNIKSQLDLQRFNMNKSISLEDGKSAISDKLKQSDVDIKKTIANNQLSMKFSNKSGAKTDRNLVEDTRVTKGPLTSRQRVDIINQISSGSSKNAQIANWFVSQIDMVRFLSRVCYKLKKIERRSTAKLQQNLYGLRSNILKEVKELTLLQQRILAFFKESEEHIKLKQIASIYQSKGIAGKFQDFHTLNALLVTQINELYFYIRQSYEFKQNQIKALDYMVTCWQLLKVLKKKDLKVFCLKSKIDLIVDGKQEKAKIQHFLQLYERMKILKLISK